jgi:16S rRNA (cytidine1402-2'-O)-methyltransferase
MSGKLIVGSMPIGNLDDITIRMLDALKTADYIYSDFPDMYITSLLIKHNINKEIHFLESVHSCHSEKNQLNDMMQMVKEGKTVLLIASEGQVALSDPGIQFIQECIINNLNYVVLPGANAGVQAIVSSGHSSGRVFILPTIEPRNFEKDFPRLRDITNATTVYISGKLINRAIEIIDTGFKWVKDGETAANRLVSLCCDLTKDNAFIITDWAHNIKNHSKISQINENTKLTILFGDLIHTDDCDHHICNDLRSIWPGQKFMGTPQKPIDRNTLRCRDWEEHGKTKNI